MARPEEPSDLDTYRDRDSRPDSRQSDLASERSEIETISDEDEPEEDEEDEKELESYDDNELDKDYRPQLEHKIIKNDFYPPRHPTTKFINGSSLPATAQLAAATQQPTGLHGKPGAYSTQLQVNSILPHYMPNHHLISSAANSDKLSITADNHRLSKKAKELRKSEYKREYQRLDNQPYMMHSPSQNTSTHNSNHMTASVKSGCNL